jgi:hypothetical protein
MFVLCVVSKDKRQNVGQSRQRTKYGWGTEYKRKEKNTAGGSLCCALYSKNKGRLQEENQWQQRNFCNIVCRPAAKTHATFCSNVMTSWKVDSSETVYTL